MCYGRDQGAYIITQSGAHMQQLNSGNEGYNTGVNMGVFPSGSDRSIGQNSSFLNCAERTQGGNDVDITVGTTVLKYDAYVDASSVLRPSQTRM